MTKFLVAHGANVSFVYRPPDATGLLAPMLEAAKECHIAVMQYLKEQGAPFEVSSGPLRTTALHSALESGVASSGSFRTAAVYMRL